MIALLTRLAQGFTDGELRTLRDQPSAFPERAMLASRDQQDAALMLKAAFEIIGGLTGDCPKFRHKADAVAWLETFTGHRRFKRTEGTPT